tara:strand:+ start:373 stop:570 length:198 start_codon:yes stop_codon:yes gene_type:complete
MISQMLIKRKKSLSKDDLDLFMEYKMYYFSPYRKYHSMDANTFYISFPKPPLTRNIAGTVKVNSK